jgi:hypothetical protein
MKHNDRIVNLFTKKDIARDAKRATKLESNAILNATKFLPATGEAE